MSENYTRVDETLAHAPATEKDEFFQISDFAKCLYGVMGQPSTIGKVQIFQRREKNLHLIKVRPLRINIGNVTISQG